MLQTAISPNAFSADDVDDAPYEARLRRPARPHVLLASLGVAAVTFTLSGASMLYAFTHIPTVDPDAEAAPLAAVAALQAEAPATPAKLDVLPPPVYAGAINEAPAVAFVPLSARAHMDTATIDAVDPYRLAQADGVAAPCADPCTAQAGYVVEPPTDNAQADNSPERPVHATAANITQNDDDDADGNAPPPPDLTEN